MPRVSRHGGLDEVGYKITHSCYSCNVAAKKPKINWNDNLADFKNAVVKAAKNDPIVGQNIKYFQSAQRGAKDVVKTAAKDVAVSAAGAGAGKLAGAIGAAVGKTVGKKVGESVADTAFSKLATGLDKASSGGKVFKTNTPFGPTLASTKIMTGPQREAAIGGLTKVASNRANEIGSSVGGQAASIVSKTVNAAGKTVAANAAKTVDKKNNKRR